MEANKDLYQIINLKLSAHKTPVFKEEKNKDWVIYGTDKEGGYYNNYPAYYLYLYNRSSKHNAFINGKVHYIYGQGLAFDTTNLTLAEVAEANDFLNKKNANGDNLKDVVRKAILDKKLFGGYYLEIIWNKAGTNFDILHIDYNCLRISKDRKGYWYSNDWSKAKQTPEDTGLEFIPNFNADKPAARQIWCAKEYRPNLEYYPMPDYQPAVVYAEVDVEISNYRLNAIKSGFNAGTLLNLNNGNPTPEEKDDLESALKDKFSGTDRANSLLLMFNRSKDNAPTIEHLTPQNVDEQLNGLNEQVTQELIIGHRITNPILVGVKTEGQLGGADETLDSFQLFKSGYVVPNRIEIENDFNYLLSYKGFSKRLYLKDLAPLEKQLPIEKKLEVMTKNEIRELFDLEPLEEEVKPVISSTVHRFGEPDCCEMHFNEEEESEIERSIEVFRQYGEDLDEYEFVNKKYIFNAVTSDDIFEDEIKNYSFDILEGDVKLLYRNILELLSKDPLIPNEQLAKALNTNLNRVNVAVNRLVSDGAIELGEKTSGDEKTQVRKPTKDAIKVLDSQGSAVEQMRIMYTYEPRPGMKKPLLPTSREFCTKLIKANKIFTRQQIEQISSTVGWDVWTKRGGWYTQKGGAVTTPFCRHVWVQNVVRKKSK